MFVGNAGSPQGRLRRALAVGDPLIAITAAADVERARAGRRARARGAACCAARTRAAAGLPRARPAASRSSSRASTSTSWRSLVSGLERMLGGADAPLGLRLALERRGLRAAREQLDR